MRHALSLAVFFVAASMGACAAPSPLDPTHEVAGPPPFQVKVVGHGPPMVLIPGLASPGAVWDDVVAHYQGRYTCHVLTLAGFAGTAPRSGPFLVAQRRALAAYVRDQRLDKPVIVGHSLGGVLAMGLAEEDPDLAGRLVIVDSLPFLPAAANPAATPQSSTANAEELRTKLIYASPEDRRRLQLMSARTLVTSDENVERVAAWTMKSDVETLGNALYDVMTTDLRPGLPRIHAPTLVVGTWAGYAPRQTRAETLAIFESQYAGLSGAQIALADHARHFVMLDDPAELLRLTDTFLDATSTPAR